MNKDELLQKLLDIYKGSFDIEEPYDIKGDIYDAYAFCNITNAKYVLIKKAELWRAICYEHAFFRRFDSISGQDIERFTKQIQDEIEPNLVRGGKPYMEKDHMYTYITGIFISEKGISKEVRKKIQRARFYKNYLLSVRGYSQMRILVIDLENHTIIGNGASRDLIKDYKKFI
ncbi:MAG: hypothetical protein EOM40_08555 [Clostridia bacterium]|nr:hypothetical protein [Clostridia bacterium]NCC43273.1 hypothetical protein [Clostridia bacterium]